MSNQSSGPARLHFDDGSRLMMEQSIDLEAPPSNIEPNPTDTTSTTHNIRGDTPIPIYYEIDRVASDIIHQLFPKVKTQEIEKNRENNNPFLCKVALQFPDELLNDSPQVSWLLDQAISSTYQQYMNPTTNNNNLTQESDQNKKEQMNHESPLQPLVFILGDTTYGSCDSDEIGAKHLNADILVHYGDYASLNPTDTLPVIYSFGKLLHGWTSDETNKCCQNIMEQIQLEQKEEREEWEKKKVLVMYDLKYHHAMEELVQTLETEGKDVIDHVVLGSIPVHEHTHLRSNDMNKNRLGSCCENSSISNCYTDTDTTTTSAATAGCNTQDQCCASDDNNAQCNMTTSQSTTATTNEEQQSTNITEITQTLSSQIINETNPIEPTTNQQQSLIIGGLYVPLPPSALSNYTLLYIGDDTQDSTSRRFLNTILQCTATSTATKQCWSYNPTSTSSLSSSKLCTDPYSSLHVSRYINRRFYLTQKAKLANIIGILVGTLSQTHFRTVLTTLQSKIEASGRACYTFVVGKINIAKVANFAEVECFVLVGSDETSILREEREYHVPIITPMELDVALGLDEWKGCASCTTDFNVFLKNDDGVVEDSENHNNEESTGLKTHSDEEDEEDSDQDDDDQPFFSMISGTYVSKPTPIQSKFITTNNADPTSSSTTSTNGQIIEYKSEAAEFWKQREYKGLESQIGNSEVKAAVKGQTGIASNYGK